MNHKQLKKRNRQRAFGAMARGEIKPEIYGAILTNRAYVWCNEIRMTDWTGILRRGYYEVGRMSK